MTLKIEHTITKYLLENMLNSMTVYVSFHGNIELNALYLTFVVGTGVCKNGMLQLLETNRDVIELLIKRICDMY